MTSSGNHAVVMTKQNLSVLLTSIIFTVPLKAYEWLVARLLVDSDAKLRGELNRGKDSFSARNDSQVYYCRSLAITFIEVNILWLISSGIHLSVNVSYDNSILLYPLPQFLQKNWNLLGETFTHSFS